MRHAAEEPGEAGLQDEAAAIMPAILTGMSHQPLPGERHALPSDVCPAAVNKAFPERGNEHAVAEVMLQYHVRRRERPDESFVSPFRRR